MWSFVLVWFFMIPPPLDSTSSAYNLCKQACVCHRAWLVCVSEPRLNAVLVLVMSHPELPPPPDMTWVCVLTLSCQSDTTWAKEETVPWPTVIYRRSSSAAVFTSRRERPRASWTLWWGWRSHWGRPSRSWPAVCRGWRRGSCVPNAETRGEEEEATGWGGPLLSELHIPETQ